MNPTNKRSNKILENSQQLIRIQTKYKIFLKDQIHDDIKSIKAYSIQEHSFIETIEFKNQTTLKNNYSSLRRTIR